MRLAGMAEFLVSGTNTVPNHACHDRRGMHFFRENHETIRENGSANIFCGESCWNNQRRHDYFFLMNPVRLSSNGLRLRGASRCKENSLLLCPKLSYRQESCRS